MGTLSLRFRGDARTLHRLHSSPIRPFPDTFPISKPQSIDICLLGAVEHPGIYQVPPNSTMKRAALALSPLMADANLKKIKWDAPVRQGQVIKVAKLSPKKSVKEKKTQQKRKKLRRVILLLWKIPKFANVFLSPIEKGCKNSLKSLEGSENNTSRVYIFTSRQVSKSLIV